MLWKVRGTSHAQGKYFLRIKGDSPRIAQYLFVCSREDNDPRPQLNWCHFTASTLYMTRIDNMRQVSILLALVLHRTAVLSCKESEMYVG